GASERRGPDGPWPRKVDDATTSELLNQGLDSAVNLIDTAPDYGLSEGLIGKHISQRRDELSLATKCGCMVSLDGAPLARAAKRSPRTTRWQSSSRCVRRARSDSSACPQPSRTVTPILRWRFSTR